MATFNYQDANSSRQQLPGNFFDYQKMRQPGVTQTKQGGGTTSTVKPATQWQTYKPQSQQQMQPGGVSRPDGRPTPGEQPAQAQVQSTPPPAPTPPPVDRNAIVQQLMKDTGKNEADATAWAERFGYFNPQQQAEQRGQATGQPVSGPQTGGVNTGVPQTPTGGYWLNQMQQYTPMDFSQINSPIYNPNQFEFQGPQEYGDYQKFNYQTQIPTQGYQAGQINQFTGPDQSQLEGGLNSLMQHLLANPTSMTDTGVAQMKEKQKEQILQSQKAMAQQNAELMAQRGMVGGGQDMAQQMALQNQAQKDLLSSYRDVDLKKMEQDFADRKSIAELGDAIMTGQMGRATDAYTTGLEGQKARESALQAQDTSMQNLAKLGLSKEELMAGENKNVFDAASQKYRDQLQNIQAQLDTQKLNQAENFKGFDSQSQAVQDALKAMGLQASENQFGYGAAQDNALNMGKFAEGDATRNLQQLLAEKGFGVDYAKIAQNSDLAKMDDLTKRYGINMDFVNSMLNRDQSGSQFNKTMAFNTKGQDNSFFQWMMSQGLI